MNAQEAHKLAEKVSVLQDSKYLTVKARIEAEAAHGKLYLIIKDMMIPEKLCNQLQSEGYVVRYVDGCTISW